ncbi:MAG: hypothetical protein CMI02_16725 [Oceanospirillaceae bacterium]|nr:hypothetical protein [Oceanospirillaceae bacterium]MBT13666.1 hypothetical protein [Oceanospirillaceae bacterium]|tara:strand:+ start:11108 stop:11707 length:600 start_codon:yes stop_codon:yes gene_type:complete
MRKLMIAMTAAAIFGSLSGCVLAPQTIALNENVSTPSGQLQTRRDALVRVVDERGIGADVLGTRGGRAPENSPLLSEQPLKNTLTEKLQASLKNLGFGGPAPVEPVKVQMNVNRFSYQCNEGVVVNECGITIELAMTVMSDGKTFSKPYRINQERSLAASPVAEYNEEWVNDAIDTLWNHIFSDPELLQALGVKGVVAQ